MKLVFETKDVRIYKREEERYEEINDSLVCFTDKRVEVERARLLLVPAKGLYCRIAEVSPYGDVADWESYNVDSFIAKSDTSRRVYVISVGDTFYSFNGNTLERVEDIPQKYTMSEKDVFYEQVDRFMKLYSCEKVRVVESKSHGTFIEKNGHIAKLGCGNGYKILSDAGCVTKSGVLRITRDKIIELSNHLADDLPRRAEKLRCICEELS